MEIILTTKIFFLGMIEIETWISAIKTPIWVLKLLQILIASRPFYECKSCKVFRLRRAAAVDIFTGLCKTFSFVQACKITPTKVPNITSASKVSYNKATILIILTRCNNELFKKGMICNLKSFQGILDLFVNLELLY